MTAQRFSAPSRRVRLAILAGILLISAGFRLSYCNASPEGLQVDEASNVWNAYTLASSEFDEHQQHLPIFYTRAFGDYRSPLFLYFLWPFVAMNGANVCTAHLAAGVYGVVAVALMYYVSSNLLGFWAGAVSALLLSVDPTHVQNTRWAHEASITAMLVLLALASLIWAKLPPVESDGKAHFAKAFIAGAIAGGACYGYAAIRLFLPVLLIAIVMIYWKRWREIAAKQRGAFIALIVGFAMTFGPLVFKHMTDTRINLRARTTWVWDETDSFFTRISKVVARYPAHFGYDFLFLHGSKDPAVRPPAGFGALHWYMLILLACGIIVLVRSARISATSRLLLAGILLYPISDVMNRHDGVNALRSFPGWEFFSIVGAVGTMGLFEYLREWRPRLLAPAVAILAVIVITSGAIFAHRFFGSFNRESDRWLVRNVDVMQACEWLRPRYSAYNAVIWTQKEQRSFLYAPSLIFLKYTPQEWFALGVDRVENLGSRYAHANLVSRYGKTYFVYLESQLNEMVQHARANGREDHVAIITAPGETDLDQLFNPVQVFRDPDGKPTLEIFELTL